MSLVTTLISFGLRQVFGETADNVVEAVEQRFRDHSQTVLNALQRAHDRAWQALAIALAGDSFLDRVRVFFASGDDKGVREQVQQFLQANILAFDGAPTQFRQDCLDELKRLRKSGLLCCQGLSVAEIGRQPAGFQRYADLAGIFEGARQAVERVAGALAEDYPNLARLLRTPTPAGPPLLAGAFCYFFRREVETDDELAHGLFLDGLRQLTAAQAKAFGEVNKGLVTLGGQFDAVFEQLGRIEAVAIETHGVVLDLQTELQRLGGLQLANTEEVRSLLAQVQHHLSQVGMQRGELRPQHSFSIRGEEERQAVRVLLSRFRQLNPDEQKKIPALLNGLGKLQVGAGDFGGAKDTFAEVAAIAQEQEAKAEAYYNGYQVALEEKKWDAALEAIRQASRFDPSRFTPFPLHRYEPNRILGAGGFDTAFLCHDHHFAEDVVVKALHLGCLNRGADELFREARILWRLKHPAIIGVRDCEYADQAHMARPYLVMDQFPGTTLQQFVEERGPLGLEHLLAVATQVAEAMKAAHAQGVLHRDLKPANILVRQVGDLWEVKVIDFGLALGQRTVETSKTRAGATQKSILEWSVAGTLDYAPPEQLGKLPGVQPGPYSDAYAFARTCCYAMFKVTELRRSQWNSLPGPLADLLEECLSPDPQQRPKGFEPVLAVLSQFSRGWEEVRLRDQEAGLRREQENEQLRQKEGEEQLRQFVRAALDQTNGKPTPADTAQAKDLCRRYKLPGDQASTVVRQVKNAWRREREEQKQTLRLVGRGSGDGKILASASAVKERETDKGQQVRSLQGHKDRVSCVAFSPNGKILASASEDSTVKMWNADKGIEILTLKGHAYGVGSVAFSPDSKRLVSASMDGTVKVWDADMGTAVLTLRGHTAPVSSVTFSPNGKRIISASGDHTVKVWDADKGTAVLTLLGHTLPLTSVAFSSGGKQIASASHDKTVKVWDADKGTAVLTLRGHTGPICSVAYSPDGKRLVSAGFDQTVKVWDADKGTAVLTLRGHTGPIHSVAYSPDGKRLVSASFDQTVKVWDADTGAGVVTLKGHTLSVNSLAFSPDGKQIATASLDQTVKVWDVDKGTLVLTLKGHTQPVSSVTYSPDGKQIASASYDQTVKVWDADKGTAILTLQAHTSGVSGVAFSPDGKQIASASEDRTVKVWDIDKMVSVAKIQARLWFPHP